MNLIGEMMKKKRTPFTLSLLLFKGRFAVKIANSNTIYQDSAHRPMGFKMQRSMTDHLVSLIVT